jgi:hypothetical protein
MLNTVLERLDRNPGGAVVFDLDSTLFDNGPRTWRILAEFVSAHHPEVLPAVRAMGRHRLAYRLTEICAGVDGWDPAWDGQALDFWMKRFFADRYINFDEPIVGAVEFVQACYGRGARIIYLTGRDVPAMLTGTAESLRSWGFPIGVPGTELVLKPDFETDDAIYKASVIERIDAYSGTVVATFENEARNLAVFERAWPTAVHLLLDTNFDPRHDSAERDSFEQLQDFTRS